MSIVDLVTGSGSGDGRVRRAGMATVVAIAPIALMLTPDVSHAAGPIAVSAHPTGTPSAAGWYDGPQQVVIDVAAEAVSSGQWTVTAANAQRTGSLDVGSTDVAVDAEGLSTVSWLVTGDDGRQSRGSIEVRIDTTDPVIEVFSLRDNAQVPRGADQPLTFRCTDAVSRAISCLDGNGNGTGAKVDTSSRGAKQATVTAVDAAGNTVVRTVPYDVIAPDTTPPVVSGRLLSGARGDNGWYRGHFVYEARAVDATVDHEARSGLDLLYTQIDGQMSDTTQGTRTVTLIDGRHTFSWAATDHAGNPSVVRSLVANVDDTTPQVSPTYPASGQHLTPASSPQARLACSDATSGVASCTAPPLDLTPGAHTLISEVRDRAGNRGFTYSDYVVDAPTTTTVTSTALHSNRPGVVTVTVAGQAPIYGQGAVFSGATQIGTFTGGERSTDAQTTKTFRVPVTAVAAGTRRIIVKYFGSNGGLPSQAVVTVEVR